MVSNKQNEKKMPFLPQELIEKILDVSDIDTRRAMGYYKKINTQPFEALWAQRPSIEMFVFPNIYQVCLDLKNGKMYELRYCQGDHYDQFSFYYRNRNVSFDDSRIFQELYSIKYLHTPRYLTDIYVRKYYVD